MTARPILPDERVRDVRCDRIALTGDLMNRRTIAVPIAWFPRLIKATDEQRADW